MTKQCCDPDRGCVCWAGDPNEPVEIVANDEPSMEDYPPVSDMEPGEHPQDGYIPPDEFGAPPLRVTPVTDGVRDTRSR